MLNSFIMESWLKKDLQDHQLMMEDGPTHSSLLLETAGGAVLPLLILTWSLSLNPRVNQSLDEAGVLHLSLAESPRAMERCVNVVYYLCNLLLIYTGGEPAQQSRIKLSTECFQFVSPRSPHKSRPGGTAANLPGVERLWREINAAKAAQSFKGNTP